MKILAPPQINSLNELLDVVLHPDKLATYLQQLKDLRDAITAQLDAYNTKAKAEEYLAQAHTKQTEAAEALRVAHATQQETDRACQARLEQLTRDQAAWTKAKEQEQAVLK